MIKRLHSDGTPEAHSFWINLAPEKNRLNPKMNSDWAQKKLNISNNVTVLNC